MNQPTPLQLLDPKNVQTLVAKAFALEALTDKPGCTTRYHDLAGKPLEDFVLAGINCAPVFGRMTHDIVKDELAGIFTYNLEALQASNQHKSSKYVNFGLLEIMFPTVYARLKVADPAQIVDEIIKAVESTTKHDVEAVLATRQLAWSTAREGSYKTTFAGGEYQECESVADFYKVVHKKFAPATSAYQWTEQFRLGLPVLREFFQAYQVNKEVLQTTKQVFLKIKQQEPELMVGILADMCAAAIFLWLSFNDSPVAGK